MQFASVAGLAAKLPLSAVSAGVDRVVTMALSIATMKGGTFCIDELDDGLYHRSLAAVWSQLWELCRKSDVQLFVTTHNWECIRAMMPLVEQHSDEFCVLRTERSGGRGEIEQFDGDALAAAFEQAIEVR